jgi:hypothetical protein
LARQKCDECGYLFDLSYEDYLLQIEPVTLSTTMIDIFIVNVRSITDLHIDNMLAGKLTKPNPVMFFPSKLSANLQMRKRQLNRALLTFVIRLEIHIESKTWYDTLDNVYWGIGNAEPSPKLSWLRYIRWRQYFLHLKLSGITRTPPDTLPIAFGPPYLRPQDKVRMGYTNCFALCLSSGQFASNNTGCHNAYDPEEMLPNFPNVKSDDIILYQFKSIWTLDLNDFDVHPHVNSTRTNTTITYKLTSLKKDCLSSRQRKVMDHLSMQYPEWGRKSVSSTATEKESAEIQDGWFTDADAVSTFNDGWQDDRPLKQQKRNDNKE